MKKLTPVLLLSFVNVIGFSILIPVLPEVLELLTGKSSGLLYGLLLSSYAFSQFLAAPILGSLSDHYGRRPILLISQFGTMVSWIIFASAYFIPRDAMLGSISIPILVIAISRITDGLTGGNISVASAWVSDRTTHEEKTKAFGLVGATFGVGFLIGPALGGFSVSTPIHFLGTAILAFAISLVTLGFIYWGLPESLSDEHRTSGQELSFMNHLNFSKKFKLFRDNDVIKNLVWVRVFFSLAFVGFTTSLILLLGRTYELTPINIGIIMSVIGVFSILNQSTVVPRLAKRFGNFQAF
ncbi:MAG: MFS transporter, partial [Candidatus Peregrinibacteria bacterium]|nr:MFS transporter [Candidatus Peregrinibacteria bacterium]